MTIANPKFRFSPDYDDLSLSVDVGPTAYERLLDAVRSGAIAGAHVWDVLDDERPHADGFSVIASDYNFSIMSEREGAWRLNVRLPYRAPSEDDALDGTAPRDDAAAEWMWPLFVKPLRQLLACAGEA